MAVAGSSTPKAALTALRSSTAPIESSPASMSGCRPGATLRHSLSACTYPMLHAYNDLEIHRIQAVSG